MIRVARSKNRRLSGGEIAKAFIVRLAGAASRTTCPCYGFAGKSELSLACLKKIASKYLQNACGTESDKPTWNRLLRVTKMDTLRT